MNVIEALVVTLGLDLRDFDSKDRQVNDSLKKFTENAEKRTAAFESAGRKAAETFSSLKTEIIGAIAAFAGFKGMQDFIEGTTNSQAALGRLAVNTNTSASTLRAWGIVATEVGGKAEDAYDAFNKMNQEMAQMAIDPKSSALLPMLRRLGITDFTNKTTPEEMLLKISKRLQQLPRNQAQYAANQMGLGSIFNELMLGPDELKKRLDQAFSTLPANFEQSTKRAQELQNQMALLKAQFEGIRDNIYNQLEPAFNNMFQGIFNWLQSIDWNAVANWINNLVPAVQGLWQQIVNLNDASGGWLKTMGLLAAAWIAFNAILSASPIGAVLLLAGAIVALWNDYQTFQKGGKSLIDWKQWKTEVGFAKDAVDVLTKSLELLGKAYDKWKGAIIAIGNVGRNWIGKAAAEKAAEVASGKTAEDRRQQGSDADKLNQQIAYYFGYDPRTGQKLSDSDLSGPPEADPSAQAPGTGSDAPVDKASSALLDRVAAVESGSNPNSPDSTKGAVGEYQIEPATGKQYGASVSDLRDPVKERKIAEAYINDLLKEFHGNQAMAMEAYNWGPGNVEKYGLTNMPKETSDYLKKLGLSVPGAGTAPGAAGVTQTTDKSTSQLQVGPIIVNVPPGANGTQIAQDIQRRLSQVNLPQALTSAAE